jgi:hypothetical protein
MSNYLAKTPITFNGAGPGNTKISFTLSPSQINGILKDYVKVALDLDAYYPNINTQAPIEVNVVIDTEVAKGLLEKTA